jgi:hypothetical protein
MLGQIGQGYAARRSADAQAQMAADQAAELRQEGIDRAAAIRKAAGKVRSSATAAYAASGVRVGEGTPATVDASIIADSEADAYAAILTGRRRATAAEIEARGLRDAGRNAQRAAFMEAGNTLLGGAASYDRWSRRQRQLEIESGRVY